MFNSRVEKQLKELEDEIAALKQSFQRSPYQLDIYTTTKTVAMGTDTIKTTNSRVLGNSEITIGRGISVTYQTTSGANTIAKISPKGRRVPYNGGAKWIIVPDYNKTAYRPLPSEDTSSFTITVSAVLPGEIVVEAL